MDPAGSQKLKIETFIQSMKEIFEQKLKELKERTLETMNRDPNIAINPDFLTEQKKMLESFPEYFLKEALHRGSKKKALIAGLDSTGKTTALYNIALNKVTNTVPTKEFNTEIVEFKNFVLECLDLGGGEKLREDWKRYLIGANINILIYFVNGNDNKRIDESVSAFKSLVKELPEDTPVLIVATHSDVNDFDTELIEDIFDIDSLSRTRKVVKIPATDHFIKRKLEAYLTELFNPRNFVDRGSNLSY